MVDKISLDDPTQVEAIRGFLDRRDYPGGYRFIGSIIEQHPDFDQNTKFWFQKAATINANDTTDQSNIFIRGATRCGLAWDGKMTQDPVRNARTLQDTSDQIARSVLGDIVEKREINGVNIFLNADIVGALASGQTIGGWGGAFYYWGAPFRPDETSPVTTVGEYIRSHPAEWEKFISCNAAMATDTAWLTRLPDEQVAPLAYDRPYWGELRRLRLIGEAIQVSGGAQAPTSVKLEIMGRAERYVMTRQIAGSPNEIDNYVYNPASRRWMDPNAFGAGFRGPVRDQNLIDQLNERRRVRLDHQGFTMPR